MRRWSIEVYIVGPDGENLPATCFDKVLYKLHESFGPRAKQSESVPVLPAAAAALPATATRPIIALSFVAFDAL